jgi:hypothetical protein
MDDRKQINMAEIDSSTPPNTLKVRLKAGVVEIELEGAEDFVQQHLDKFLESIHRSGIIVDAQAQIAPQEEYDFEKDMTVGFISGPTDLSVRAKEILQAEFGMPRNRTEE